MAKKKQKTRRYNDSLQSLSLKLGQKQAQTHYARENSLTDAELEALWVQNWIAKKICVKRSQDMVRRWRKIASNDLNADQMEAIEALERRLKLRDVLEQALAWASLYGSVVLFLKTNALNVELPLQPIESLERLVIVPKSKVSPYGSRDDDLLSPNFGRYERYQINGQITVHHSRLVIINANDPPLSEQNALWGVSDLEPVIATLKRFDSASTNIGDLIFESKTDIFHIDGLADKISAGLENEVAKTVSAVQAIKSATNSLLLDTANQYEQKELSFGGIRDLLVEFRNAVAGAADMPVTILFGQSAAGFASGAEDIQNYHESIHSLQESRLRPVLERLDPLLCNMAFGKMPQDWWFEFNSLNEMSEEQRITVLGNFANATNTLIQNSVLTEMQVLNELKESGLFSNISTEDVEELKSLQEQNNDFEPPPDMVGSTETFAKGSEIPTA